MVTAVGRAGLFRLLAPREVGGLEVSPLVAFSAIEAVSAADIARDTMSRLYAQGTRAAFIQGNPVERALRNLHAIAFSLQFLRPLYDDAGRVYLGGKPLVPVF